MVRFYFNVVRHVSAVKLPEVTLMLKATHAQESLETVGAMPPMSSSGCASHGSARRPS
jgi:hypothetical protein